LGAVRLPPQLVFPLGDVRELVEKEDAFALTLSNGLHDPDLTNSLELFHEEAVVSGEVVSGRQEIEMGGLVIFSLPLQLLLVSLQILNHQIFPR